MAQLSISQNGAPVQSNLQRSYDTANQQFGAQVFKAPAQIGALPSQPSATAPSGAAQNFGSSAPSQPAPTQSNPAAKTSGSWQNDPVRVAQYAALAKGARQPTGPLSGASMAQVRESNPGTYAGYWSQDPGGGDRYNWTSYAGGGVETEAAKGGTGAAQANTLGQKESGAVVNSGGENWAASLASKRAQAPTVGQGDGGGEYLRLAQSMATGELPPGMTQQDVVARMNAIKGMN